MTDGVTIIAGVPIPVHVSPLLVGCRLSRLAWARLHGRRHCRNVQRQKAEADIQISERSNQHPALWRVEAE
jgi:hypothetical protein